MDDRISPDRGDPLEYIVVEGRIVGRTSHRTDDGIRDRPVRRTAGRMVSAPSYPNPSLGAYGRSPAKTSGPTVETQDDVKRLAEHARLVRAGLIPQ